MLPLPLPRRARLGALAVASLLALPAGPISGQAAEEASSAPSSPRPEFWRKDPAESAGQAREDRRDNPLAQVEATDEQRAALRELMRQIQKDSRETAGKLREARQALSEAIFAEKPDESRIRKRAAEVGRLEGEIACIRARHLADARPRLSPAQLEFLRQARGEIAARLQARIQTPAGGDARPNRRPGRKPAANP